MPARELSTPDLQEAEDARRAEAFAQSLHLALRTARTHGWSNELTKDAVRTLTQAINEMVEKNGRADLHLVQEYLYVGDLLLRQDRLNFKWIASVTQDLQNRGIGSIFVDEVLIDDDVSRFLEVLRQHAEGGEQAFSAIEEALAAIESKCSVGPTRDEEGRDRGEHREITRKEMCKKTFFHAVTVAEEVMKNSHLNRRLQIRFAKRVVQKMVDLMVDEEATLLGMTTLKAHDNYTFYHSVNTCLYAIALGRRIGLTRRQLSELGTAALLHDLGKVKVPLEILGKDGPLTPEERLRIQKHPMDGAKDVIRWGRYSPLVLRVATGALEHHMNFDGSKGSYPAFSRPYQVHVVGRIISIADCFDAITTKRVYSGEAMRRDKALSFLMSLSGTKFDPVLVKLFANMIGAYPIGTCVRLASGRMAVVTGVPEDPNLCHLPVVQVISDELGLRNDLVQYPQLDLSQLRDDGTLLDEIVDALDAPAMGIDVARYFV